MHNHAEPEELTGNLIRSWGLSVEDYRDVITGLFRVAPKDEELRADVLYDAQKYPVALAIVERRFNGVSIVAEDRGALYAVWIERTQEDGALNEVVWFGEFTWGEIPLRDEL